MANGNGHTEENIDPAKNRGKQSAEKPIGLNQEKRPGNGSPLGVKTEGVKFNKTDNFPELCVLLAFAIQVTGQASVANVIDWLKKLGAKVRDTTVSDGLEALRKKEILAEAQNAEGHRVFSLKRVKFNCNPSLMDLKTLMEALTTDTAGMFIIEKFSVEDPPTERKARPELMCLFQVTIQIIRDWLGGQIWDGNQALQETYFAAPRWHSIHECNQDGSIALDAHGNMTIKERFRDHKEIPLMFERTYDSKLLVVHAAGMRGFFEKHVEAMAPSEFCKRFYEVENHMGFNGIEIEPEDKQLTIRRYPTMPEGGVGVGRRPSSPKNFECLKAGSIFSFEFTCPIKNFITPWEMKMWLSDALRYPVRSMSMARGGATGAAVLKGLRYRPLGTTTMLEPEEPKKTS